MTTRSLELDQFVPHPPDKVWRAITEPALVERWWAPGDIAAVVGHEFHLDMGEWGLAPCTVLEVEPGERFVYTFNHWTLTWRLVPEGTGTRLLLTHAGFDPDNPQDNFAFDQMGPGWRDEVLPRIATAIEAAAV